jgi:hypothetical protein
MRIVRVTRVSVLACAVLLALGAAPSWSASTPHLPPPNEGTNTAVAVSLSRSQVETKLGQSFSFVSTIENTRSTPVSGLVAHLNIVGLSEGIYVDPEDWSEDRTRRLPTLAPGQSLDVSWSVKAVTGGEAAIYVVVLPGENPSSAPEGLAVSPALDVHITEHRTLNSGGVLPLALGVPALLGIATLVARRRRR